MTPLRDESDSVLAVADKPLALQPELFEAMTRSERLELARHETRIAQAIRTLLDVGEALARIHDGQLYRSTHSNFEAYALEKWGYSKAYACRLIKAHRIRSELAGMAFEPVAERVVRPMIELESSDEHRLAWRRAIEKAEGRAPDWRHVTSAVREIAPPKDRPSKRDKGPSSIPGVQVVTVERIVAATRKAGKSIVWQTVDDEDGTPTDVVIVASGTATVRDLIAGLESMLDEIEGR